MTFEDLQRLGRFNTSGESGRPSPTMTDKYWQQKFEVMRSIVTVSSRKTPPFGIWDRTSQTLVTYDGDPQYHYFITFIRSILASIRTGHRDYCFYTYQIAELLKYENDRLRTKYIPEDQMWEVWLERRN